MNRFVWLYSLLMGFALACSESPDVDTGEQAAPETSAQVADGEAGNRNEAPPTATPAGDPGESDPAGTGSITATETRVTGTINGTQVELVEAELDNQLAIFEKDGWGFSPSLLIFMFLEDGESPEGKTFSVSPEDELQFDVTMPHVHYRWRGGEDNRIETEVVSMGYDLELKLGQIENGELPGEISFSVPGEDTSVKGTFRATIKE